MSDGAAELDEHGFAADGSDPVGYDGKEEPPFGTDENGRPLGPPCPECGENMTAGSWGHAPHTGATVDVAGCDDCEIGWGPFTGYFGVDG